MLYHTLVSFFSPIFLLLLTLIHLLLLLLLLLFIPPSENPLFGVIPDATSTIHSEAEDEEEVRTCIRTCVTATLPLVSPSLPRLPILLFLLSIICIIILILLIFQILLLHFLLLYHLLPSSPPFHLFLFALFINIDYIEHEDDICLGDIKISHFKMSYNAHNY